jgi:hypothetical protein
VGRKPATGEKEDIMRDWPDPVPEDQPMKLDEMVEETEHHLEEADEETRAAEKSLQSAKPS